LLNEKVARRGDHDITGDAAEQRDAKSFQRNDPFAWLVATLRVP
jgi:hypothetical protein